ncbi:uncharacterized protein LOC126262368 [Schistocerca nitens]|uniref:uncharacterized protein LOC126262368 n=1 Tax=Schistocerca nitens TaxID=7011 RepID=UPI0021197D73|nr:uncharacterized protein LOC126262368 [Schistocerca nitens]
METAESPLDVLSRAATMVRDNSPPRRIVGGEAVLKRGMLPAVGRVTAPRTHAQFKITGPCRSELADTPSTAQAEDSDTPLDMSTRGNGLPPPSYSEAMSAIAGHRPGHCRQMLSGECDPLIDEHFRRSLGDDYMNLYNADTKRSSRREKRKEVCDDTGADSCLSVEDHFAKALGDAWLELQAKGAKLSN